MILFPAIDLRGGRCVRLAQGAFDRETAYSDDPVSVAKSFEAAGAAWLHVVDLDAARGQGDNRAVIASVAASVGIPLQVGGGVRSPLDLAALLELGVARVVVGSLAVTEPQVVVGLAGASPGRVAVGLDHRDGVVRTRGWEESSAVGVYEALAAVDSPDLGALVVTEINRDGMLCGPDLEGLASVLARTATPVIASGGVSGVEDLRALAGVEVDAGGSGSAGVGGAGLPGVGGGGLPGAGGEAVRRLAGVIVGRAIYEGKVDVAAALEALR